MNIERVIYKDGETNLQSVVYTDKAGVDRVGYVDKTVDEYLAENPGMLCIAFDEAMKRMDEAQEKIYIKPWQEITEEQWLDNLEVLPPEKWKTVNGVELFRMSEYTTGNITAHYARLGDRYFSASRRTTDNYETLAQEINALVA